MLCVRMLLLTFKVPIVKSIHYLRHQNWLFLMAYAMLRYTVLIRKCCSYGVSVHVTEGK